MKTKIFLWVLPLVILGCSRQADTVEIPIIYDEYLFIDLTINDSVKGRFLFDTGAKGLYLDSTFVATTPITPQKLLNTSIEEDSKNQTKTIPVITDKITFTIGQLQFSSNQTPILNLTGFTNQNIAGILGIKFFENYILKFNFSKNYLAILTTEQRSEMASMNDLQFDLFDDRILIPTRITIDTTVISGSFEVDLANPNYVLLSHHTATTNDLFNHPNKTEFSILDNSIQKQNSLGYDLRVKSLVFGENSFRKVITTFLNNSSINTTISEVEGTLGIALFSKFDFYIDFPKKTMYFDPRPKATLKFKPNLFGFDYQTLSTNDQKIMVVNKLYHSSAASLAGMQLGDTLVTINNKFINEYNYKKLKELFEEAGGKMAIQIKNGDRLKTIHLLGQETN